MANDNANPKCIPIDAIKAEVPQIKPTYIFDCRQCLVTFVVAFVVSMVVVFAIGIIGTHVTIATDQPLILAYDGDNTIDVEPPRHQLIQRFRWGGDPPLKQPKPMKYPADLVIIAHTATKSCSTIPKCSQIVAAVQKHHFQTDTDIRYNFLIGGDGNAYVGRGWGATNPQSNHSISVSFIGNYLRDFLSEDMIEALQELLAEGVALGKLDDDYKIVCHNQTKATLSPGVNVYKVIQTWSRFLPGRLRS
jgi:hypothetical protein